MKQTKNQIYTPQRLCQHTRLQMQWSGKWVLMQGFNSKHQIFFLTPDAAWTAELSQLIACCSQNTIWPTLVSWINYLIIPIHVSPLFLEMCLNFEEVKSRKWLHIIGESLEWSFDKTKRSMCNVMFQSPLNVSYNFSMSLRQEWKTTKFKNCNKQNGNNLLTVNGRALVNVVDLRIKEYRYIVPWKWHHT